jgi:hypothetical protein
MTWGFCFSCLITSNPLTGQQIVLPEAFAHSMRNRLNFIRNNF